MLNKAILIGRLTKDPELKSTGGGTSVLSFTLAVKRNYKSIDNTYATDFVNCVAYRQTAEFISNYFKKGNMIAIEGRLQTRSWESDGKKRTVTEIAVESVTFCGEKKDTESLPELPEGFGEDDGRTPDDDLPF